MTPFASTASVEHDRGLHKGRPCKSMTWEGVSGGPVYWVDETRDMTYLALEIQY